MTTNDERLDMVRAYLEAALSVMKNPPDIELDDREYPTLVVGDMTLHIEDRPVASLVPGRTALHAVVGVNVQPTDPSDGAGATWEEVGGYTWPWDAAMSAVIHIVTLQMQEKINAVKLK